MNLEFTEEEQKSFEALRRTACWHFIYLSETGEEDIFLNYCRVRLSEDDAIYDNSGHSVVYGERGTGKTAACLNLVSECRSNLNDLRAAVVPVRLPDKGEKMGWQYMTDAAVEEVFFVMAHSVFYMEEMDETGRKNLTELVYKTKGKSVAEAWSEWVEESAINVDGEIYWRDPAKNLLPNPPDARDMEDLKVKLQSWDAYKGQSGEITATDFMAAVKLQQNGVGNNGGKVYIAVDTPAGGNEDLSGEVEWLVTNTAGLEGVGLKMFLPAECKRETERVLKLAGVEAETFELSWNKQNLERLLAERSLVASGGDNIALAFGRIEIPALVEGLESDTPAQAIAEYRKLIEEKCRNEGIVPSLS